MCREVVEQLALAPAHPLRAAESFEVGASDVGEDAVVGLGDRGQQRNLAAGAGAHLHDAELGLASHGQQGQRHADVVVEVAPGRIDPEAAGEHAADELLGRGLAVAARDGENRNAQRPAVGAGQLLERMERVADQQDAAVGSGGCRVVRHGGRGPLFEGFGGEAIAIEGGTPEGEKDRTRLDVPGIGRDARMGAVEIVEIRYACLHCGTSLRRCIS